MPQIWRHRGSDVFVEAVLAPRAALLLRRAAPRALSSFCGLVMFRWSFPLEVSFFFFLKTKNLNSRFRNHQETDALRSGGFPPRFLPIYSPFTTSLLACLKCSLTYLQRSDLPIRITSRSPRFYFLSDWY